VSTALDFLPYGRQSIDETDIQAVAQALRQDYLTTGPAVGAFEAAFAKAVGAGFAVASNSGTAALHLACMALDLGPGDSVVVPAVTFLATANAARFCGAEVIFADVDPDSGRLTAETFQAAIERHPNAAIRAVLPVHLNGHCADMVAIRGQAERHRIAIVEDACHALGGRHHAGNGTSSDVGACALSDLACFSLHPVKTMTTGEGGITTTNDEGRFRRMQMLRSHGMVRNPAAFEMREQAFAADQSPNPWYYEMADLGYNYRITDFACALGQSQLRRLEFFVDRRRRLAARYDAGLQSLAPLIRPVRGQIGDEAALHLYAVLIDFKALGTDRATVMARLKSQGIGTMVHYLPVNRQPYYIRRGGRLSLPGADSYYERVLSIPLYPDMSDDDVDRVIHALQGLIA
jgi:UDP-4-amino-4,6-dideoxy-N-acetyl-beta-L-altrosamine transaminase